MNKEKCCVELMPRNCHLHSLNFSVYSPAAAMATTTSTTTATTVAFTNTPPLALPWNLTIMVK